jgi:ABC-type branched-subunit amino acid transport system substrate-binding protein
MNHFSQPHRIYRLGLIIVALSVCLLTGASWSMELSTGGDGERLFQEAVASYRATEYDRAIMGFRGVLRDFPGHRRVTAALLMQAKCHYWLQSYGQAVESLQTLIGDYEQSTYLDNARYLLGNCFYRQAQPWRAADQFRLVIEDTDVPGLAELARDCLRVLMVSELSLRQLHRLFDILPQDELSPWILIEIAERELAAGHREEAMATADEVLSLFPETAAATEAARIKDAAILKTPQKLTLGVLSPLSGPYATYGLELRHGVEQAVEEHNTSSDLKIELAIGDSRGSAVKALQSTKTLIGEDKVLAIVGPLLSTVAVGAATASDLLGVPLITPTAADAEVATIGRFIFQRSVAARTLSRKVAAYASEELALRQFALLAPADDYGKAAVDGFSEAIAEHGGKILGVAWYQPGSTDFKDQLVQIRRIKQAYDDSLRALGLFIPGGHPAEPDTLPPEERRVYIDGMFIPAYPKEAGMVAPQLAFHRLETQILGTSAWGDRDALAIGGHYLEGTVFATDYSEELVSEEYDRFAADYRVRHGQQPGKVAVFSYECAKLILAGVSRGVRGREGLYQFLSSSEDYPGLTGAITFARNNGANDEAMILTIQEGRAIRLQQLPAAQREEFAE